MARDMSQFFAYLRRDVNRWKSDIATFEAEGQFEIAAAIKDWVAEAERIIKQFGSDDDA